MMQLRSFSKPTSKGEVNCDSYKKVIRENNGSSKKSTVANFPEILSQFVF